MTESPKTDTTRLLRAWAAGDEQSLNQLVPRVHRELRRLAARLLRNEREGCSLQATDMVQEVYQRLMAASQLDWQHRAHFFAVAATMMRRILLNRARRHAAAKRGANGALVNLDSGRRFIAQALARIDRSRRCPANSRHSRPPQGPHGCAPNS